VLRLLTGYSLRNGRHLMQDKGFALLALPVLNQDVNGDTR
jgi:hypothetical protein